MAAAGRGELIVCCCAHRKEDTAFLALLGGVARLVPGSLIEFREGISKTVTEIRRATVLVLEDGVFDDGGPDRAVLFVASLESTVLFLCKGTALLAARLFKDGAAVGKGRAHFAGEVCLCVGVVLLVRVGEVGAKAVGCELENRGEGGTPSPILEVDGGAIVECELGVLEDGFPIANAPLKRGEGGRRREERTHGVAPSDEHLGLLLGPLFALFLLLDDEAAVVCDFAKLALAFWHGRGQGEAGVVAKGARGDETGGRGEGERDATLLEGGRGRGGHGSETR